ncbi:hypothetical protein TrLO_g6995 [Triparma laevis f. longispina]|uniref:Uncharacterized protein n=1 Tax=Triparma laevis f. longispina TaxID=1714387 RepID=A0A9W7KRN3_9STRA|nr:hypothetical protein TrLO_g6995 [Triparma laevis f. longispina]
MLELLTADEMKACDTESVIQAAVDEKKATLGENKSAMADIVDYTAREKATVLQTKMFGELGAANVDGAQATFDELKSFCGDQAKRLDDFIAVVKFQVALASWYEEEFQVAMNEIAAVFNALKSCEDICEYYGINNTGGKWSKELQAEVFNLDVGSDEIVKAKFGPPKGFPRAHEKTKYNIYGLKNKYLQETFKEPPNLHMNLEIKDGWLCEVQMLFRNILLIKKELHKFYDVNRADGPFVVAGKLFKSLADTDEKQRDKDSKYRSMGEEEGGLLEIVKSKEAQLEEAKKEIEDNHKEIERLKESTSEKDAEIARLKKTPASTKVEKVDEPPPPPTGHTRSTNCGLGLLRASTRRKKKAI